MMNWVDQIVAPEIVARLGWVLLHSIWQGVGIAALLAAALAVLRGFSASARYLTALAALAVTAMLPVATCFYLAPARMPGSTPSTAPLTVTVQPGPPVTPPMRLFDAVHRAPTNTLDGVVPALVPAWICGVLLLSLYRAGGWMYVHLLRKLGIPESDPSLLHRFEALCRQLDVPVRVAILRCPRIDSPAVIGWLRPAILLPLACVMNLSPQQLDAILAHELAHVRRGDYLVNLVQTAIETLLFFHPAVWWISRRIRIERENCCDDLAIRACGDRVTYASALTALEELRATPSAALAATGGRLLDRIRRIALPDSAARRANWWPAGLLAVLAFALVTFTRPVALSADATTRPATNSTRVVTVLCVDEDGETVVGADVRLFDTTWEEGGPAHLKTIPPGARTDGNGIARFAGLPNADAQHIDLIAYARVPGKLAGLTQANARIMGSTLPTEQLKLLMQPIETVRGKVTVPDGFNPADARVRLAWLSNLKSEDGRRTGGGQLVLEGPGGDERLRDGFEFPVAQDGTFSIPDIPVGGHVSVFAGGSGLATAFVGANREAAPGQPHISVSLARESVIEGQIRFDDPAQQASGLKLVARIQSGSGDTFWSFGNTAIAEAPGTFRFDGLMAGVYTIVVENIPPDQAVMPAVVRVGPGETVADLQLRVERGRVLTGRVVDARTDAPCAGAQISAETAELGINERIALSPPTDERGRFSIRLPEGVCKLWIGRFPEGLGPVDPNAQESITVDASKSNPLAEVLFQVGPYQENDDVRRLTAPRASVSGRVVDPNGNPIAQAPAQLHRWHPLAQRFWMNIGGRTKLDGSYEYPNLDGNEKYRIVVPLWSTTAAESKELTLAPGEKFRLGDLVATPRAAVGQVSGAVVDDKGNPVLNAWVMIEKVESVRTAADGRFNFSVYDADREFEVSVRAASFTDTAVNGIRTNANDVRITLKPKVPGAYR
jgi:beta-lactamase regulating signal transducer with metallopeptidase domain